jgi:hypothetical protein
MSTLPHSTGTDSAPRFASPSDGHDPRTDEGLRQAAHAVGQSGWWDQPAGRRLLVEIRWRAVRNAAHVATATGVAMERGLVDDVLLAAWLVLRRHGDKVLAAACPWAYLMSSAQKQVLDEVRAQQLLTNTASIRGRPRGPSQYRPTSRQHGNRPRRGAPPRTIGRRRRRCAADRPSGSAARAATTGHRQRDGHAAAV